MIIADIDRLLLQHRCGAVRCCATWLCVKAVATIELGKRTNTIRVSVCKNRTVYIGEREINEPRSPAPCVAGWEIKMTFKIAFFSTVLVTALSIVPASAATTLISAAPINGTTTTFTATGGNSVAAGSIINLNGLLTSGTTSWYYGNGGYGIQSNGSWSNFSYASTNSSTGTITFDLGSTFSSAGAFLNYSPATFDGTPFITALDSARNVVATYNLATLAPVSTPGAVNDGAFRGIQSDISNIRYLSLTGGYLLAHSVTTANVAAVPEPATWAMMILGMGAIGYSMRRRIKVSNVNFTNHVRAIAGA